MSWELDLNKMLEEKNILMQKENILVILLTFGFLVLALLLLPLTAAVSSYVRSAPAYTYGQQIAPYTGAQLFPVFDRSMCQAGQDFILQVDPLGCTPSVVRSDLLEEQEVAVFCPISATQLNPMIKIKDIDYLVITPKDVPKDVLTVGYYPANAALGKWDPDITTNYFGNIGYATIVLRRQPNESAMPNFVRGNLTARMVYDIDNALGTGRALYYLPQLTEDEWNRDYTAYGFWDGRGYLRLDGSDNEGATIGVYSDRDITGSGRLGEKTKIATLHLKKGETSQEVWLPGFNYCMGDIQVQLNGLENPDTRARIRVDSEVIEVAQGEKFLENKCTVNEIIKQGINQKVQISCQEDEKRSSFLLRINPKIQLFIGDVNKGYSIEEKNTLAKEYGVGDYLYTYTYTFTPLERAGGKPEKETRDVYLGFIGNSRTTNSAKDLYIRLISIPRGTKTTYANSLSETELSYIADYDKSGGVLGVLEKITAVARNYIKGNKVEPLLYSDIEKGVFEQSPYKISILGYSGIYDADLSQMPEAVKNNYTEAMEDYKTIKDNEAFSGEIYPPNEAKTLGQKALEEAIELSANLGQKSTTLELCGEFTKKYSYVLPTCEDELLLSNTQISSQSVVINRKTHVISFERAREPSFDEFGLEITVSYPDGKSKTYSLSKNEIVYLDNSNTEYIQLIGLEKDTTQLEKSYATLRTSLKTTVGGTITNPLTQQQKLIYGVPETFGSSYSFSIQEIKLQKVAKVSINPRVDYARANTTINFNIGIEKRAIQLSPEKTKERIKSLNETIEKITKISDGLGKVVETGKVACLATTGALMVKNFFLNLGGKGIARQAVMRAAGVGWYDKCQSAVRDKSLIDGKGPFKDVDACLLANSDAIDNSVNNVYTAMEQQNQEMKRLEEGISHTSFLGEKVVNTDKLTAELIKDQNFKDDISPCISSGKIDVGGEKDVDIATKIASQIKVDTTSLTQARSLQLNCKLQNSNDPTVAAIAKKQVEKTLGEIYSNSRTEVAKETFTSKYGISPIIGASRNLKEFPLTDVKMFSQVSNKFSGVTISPETYVTTFVDQATAKEYLFTLKEGNVISQTYLITDGVLSVADPTSKNVNPLGISLKKYDSSSYHNLYQNPEVRYYETDPYKGFPAVVPFDTKNGWYAAVKSTLPLLGGLKSYDASGRVSSFYVCNVGPDEQEDFIGDDDICRGFVPETGQAPDFPGLTKEESAKKMNDAVSAISQAQKMYKAGVKDITINNQRIKVGKPAANIPDIECTDFMSPTDCNIMFNVCDPVICPSSRCDLGGAYPVKDVIQSGIAGSIALCLPNWPEVKVPICVSGVHAGLEAYTSVLSSYQQCLQTSLDTGQTVGICDEINSIYMCEFFWKEGLPLIKYAIPKVIGSVLGQNVRGGGEYLGVADAWSNAGKSIDYFSQYYAANSFKAFKARSVEGVGEEICKNWVSLTGPKGNLFDSLIAPDSPAQFYGRFEEIEYTTATTPPASQYKVFYHIYAGKDLPAYYQVYLRGTGSSFYQDTASMRPVASGFIKTGDFKSETIDFTAPSGYKELCIVVNGQEECGFKQVTTEFGLDYLSEKYVQEQASQKDIKTEAECVSGDPSAYSLLNLNLQAGATEALNPAIYNRGIIRVCSTDNPGKTSDPAIGTANQRWKEVGYCGSQNLKCWLDADSVKDVIKNANIENQTLQAVQSQVTSALQGQGTTYLNSEGFEARLKTINDISDTNQPGKITEINNIIGKVYLNNQKAYLYLKRGNAYGNLAEKAHTDFKNTKKEPATTTGEKATTPIIKEPTATAIIEEKKCEDCGGSKGISNFWGVFDLCDRDECTNINPGTGKKCVFKQGGFSGAVYVPNSCTEETIPITETITTYETREKIVSTTRNLVGTPFIRYDQLSTMQKNEIDQSQTIWTWGGIQIIRDNDSDGSINCFDSVMHLYIKAGVRFAGFKYCLNDGIVDVDKDSCEKNDDITKDNVEQGDILSIRYSGTIHNIIFLRWIDKNSGRAEVFDWIAQADKSKFPSGWAGSTRAFRSFEVDLKFNEQSEDWTVYAVGKPTL